MGLMASIDYEGLMEEVQEASRNQQSLKEGTKASRSRFMGDLDRFRDSYDDFQDRADVTKEDLYGDELRSISDKAMAAANNTKQALSRALAAGGGDVTGEASGQMLEADARSMDAISEAEDVYDEKYRNYQDSQEAQAMQMLAQAMGAEGQLMNSLQNQSNFNRQLQAQKEQADDQFWADIAGSILGSGAKVATGFM